MARYNKFFVAVAGALIMVLLTLEDGHIDLTEWVKIGISIITAILVFLIGNKEKEDDGRSGRSDF